jgi:hypothetical protein
MPFDPRKDGQWDPKRPAPPLEDFAITVVNQKPLAAILTLKTKLGEFDTLLQADMAREIAAVLNRFAEVTQEDWPEERRDD